MSAPSVRRGTPSRILVAEDHEANWLLLERLLTLRGHVAERAEHGDRVLDLVGDGGYDLILMDCQMPVRDGFETARELRRRERAGTIAPPPSGAPRIPIVAMTASVMVDGRERCLAAGMDEYLEKPIRFDELDAVLGRSLSGPNAAPVGRAGAGVAGDGDGRAAGDGDGRAAGDGDGAAVDGGAVRLDPARVSELRTLFPGPQLGEVIAEMSDEVERDLRELSAAVDERNPAQVAAAAHRIRNTGNVVGARALVELAGVLDRPPRDDRPPVEIDPAAVGPLEACWRQVRTALAGLVP